MRSSRVCRCLIYGTSSGGDRNHCHYQCVQIDPAPCSVYSAGLTRMRTHISLSLFVFVLSFFHSAASAAGSGPPDNNLPIGNVTTARLIDAAAEPDEWFTGGRDYQQSYYSPLANI